MSTAKPLSRLLALLVFGLWPLHTLLAQTPISPDYLTGHWRRVESYFVGEATTTTDSIHLQTMNNFAEMEQMHDVLITLDISASKTGVERRRFLNYTDEDNDSYFGPGGFPFTYKIISPTELEFVWAAVGAGPVRVVRYEVVAASANRLELAFQHDDLLEMEGNPFSAKFMQSLRQRWTFVRE